MIFDQLGQVPLLKACDKELCFELLKQVLNSMAGLKHVIWRADGSTCPTCHDFRYFRLVKIGDRKWDDWCLQFWHPNSRGQHGADPSGRPLWLMGGAEKTREQRKRCTKNSNLCQISEISEGSISITHKKMSNKSGIPCFGEYSWITLHILVRCSVCKFWAR